MKLKLNREEPRHPGEVLKEKFLTAKSRTQSELADTLGWTKAKLNELVKGKRGITAESALDLSEVLGTSASIWLNLQSEYDLARARINRSKTKKNRIGC